MIKKQILLTALIAASATIAVPAFADDWDDDFDAAAGKSQQAEAPRSRSSAAEESSVDSAQNSSGWEFSIQGAYLLASDPLAKGASSDFEIDMGGVNINIMKTMPGQNVGLEYGLMFTVAAGTADGDWDYGQGITCSTELTQIETMAGARVGVRFSGSDTTSPSFSLGAMVGVDWRYLKEETKAKDRYNASLPTLEDSGSGVGFFYGVYASGELPLSDHFGLTASVNYIFTQNDGWAEDSSVAEDVGYLMATVGVVFRW